MNHEKINLKMDKMNGGIPLGTNVNGASMLWPSIRMT